MFKVSVIVPTYKRSQDLRQCLQALKKQTRLADEILVIVRDTDLETQEFLNSFPKEALNLRVITVSIPGQVRALNCGLESAIGDIIAITDDDGIPHPPWLERIEAHFRADSNIGGVGGRDWMYVDGELHDGAQKTVGKVQWFGRAIGNHHLGIGESRQVEILKGANMSYRQTAIANQKFDTRLLGSGAEVHNDRAFSLSVKKAGWKLIYDPLVSIDHHHGKRFDEDLRGHFSETAWFNEVHNSTVVMLDYLSPWRRVIYLVWIILVGTRRGFGLVQLARFLPQEGNLAIRKWLISIKARWQGGITFWQKLPAATPELLSPLDTSRNMQFHGKQ